MKLSANRSGLKLGIVFFLGLSFFAFAANAGWLQIPASIDNVIQVIQRILVTDDGTQTGNPVMDINTGGNVIVYGPLLDSSNTPYITGYTETDPFWIAAQNNYYTKAQIHSQNFLVSEIDPFWEAAKSGYYSKLDIEAKGYLTGFTELDSVFVGSDAYHVTSLGIANWNTAFGRGSHHLMGYLTGETDPDWNSVKANYYTKAQVDAAVGGLAGGLTYKGSRDYSTGALPSDITTGDLYVLSNEFPDNGLPLHMEAPDQIIANKTRAGQSLPEDWDVIENDYAEQDPMYSASIVAGITALQISGWDEAHGRGNHATVGYLTNESDPIWSGDKANYYTKSAIDAKGYLTTYTETDPVFGASAAKNITNTNTANWSSAYSRGNHALMGYITGGAFSSYYTKAQIDNFGFITGVNLSNYYTKTQVDNAGFITGYTETDPQVGTLEAGKGCYSTGGKVVCDQDFTYDETDPIFSAHASSVITTGNIAHWNSVYSRGDHSVVGYLTGESDPVFMANSGNYYLASNPNNYISADTIPRTIGADITNTNTGEVHINTNLFTNGHLNIGANTNALYPLYVWADNTGDIYANYITIDGPDTVEKGFQIGGGSTSEDYKWAWYIESGDDGDKTYFANGNSKRDILTMGAGGRIGFNIPTLLGTTTSPDGFSIYPQYFDSLLRYDDATSSYIDYTADAYLSAGESFVLLSSEDDTLLIGKEYPWRATYIHIDTPAGTPGTLQVKYSKAGGTWGGVVGLSDTTNKLKQPGNVAWTLDSFFDTWERRIIEGQDLYWIQISLSSLGGAAPTSRLISNLGTNRFALYAGAGDVSPMFLIDSQARLGILPPELTGKYEMGKLPGISSTQVEIVSNETSRSDVLSYLATDETGAGAAFISARSRGTVDAKLPVVAGDVLGGKIALGYDGATFRDAASIMFGVDGTPDVMDMPGKISFFTTPDGDETAVERMTIKNTGRVGIGTTTPTQLLSVDGNINVTSGYHVYDGNGSPYVTASSLGVYLTGESDPIFSTHAAAGITGGMISNWNTAFGRGNHASVGYLTSESDPVWLAQKGGYYTKTQIDDKAFLTGESDPVFMANSGNYYLASNPNNYISADTIPRTIGADITNTNTGEVHINTNLFTNGHLNIGANTNTLYPLYVWTDNTGDDRGNYVVVDGPDTLEKGFQIGAGPTSSDYQRAWYTDNNEGGDKMYFINGESNRDVLTMAGGGRVGINVPTLLGTKTPPDLFSVFPQYFDGVLVYSGGTYIDEKDESYTSAGEPFVVAGDGHYLLLGKMNRWRAMYVDIVTPAGNSDSMLVEYSAIGGDWESVVSPVDTTNRLKIDGSIVWNMETFQSSWIKRSIDGSAELYWIKVSLDGVVGNNPTVQLITNNGVNRMAIYAGAGDHNPVFTVDANARVGIAPGSLSGKYELGRLPGLTSTQLEIVSNEVAKSDVLSYLASNVTGAGAGFISAKSKGTIDEKLSVANGDVLGGLFGFGYDGATFRSAANIVFTVDGTPDVMDMPGKISFFTTPDGDETAVERMVIRNTGRVGIGTSTPSQTLTVSGNINVTTGYDVYDGNGNAYVTMEDLSGHLIEENDPVWTFDKPNYSTTAQIEAKGYLTGFTELDPIFLGSPAYTLTTTGINSWNTAYGRGNHRLMGYLTGETDPDWNSVKTNYYTKTQVDAAVAGLAGGLTYKGSRDYSTGALPSDITTGDLYVISNEYPDNGLPLHIESPDQIIANKTRVGQSLPEDWDVIENDYAEQDPIYAASVVAGITALQISGWDEAHARGDHSLAGYLTNESDPVWSAQKSGYYTKTQIDAKGYLTTYSETDPVFLASSAFGITSTNISHWNTAYGRGNHATMGYITGYTETDPDFTASAAHGITATNITNWNTVYSRGNHADAGYIKSYSETDPVWSAVSTNYYTKAQITGLGYITAGALTPYVLLSQTGNWNTAYGRGNHASAGYALASSLSSYVQLSQTGNWNTAYNWMITNSGNALSFTTNSGNYYTKTQIDNKAFLTGETDPIFSASSAFGITATNVSNRNTAYGRGNHATMGYITSYTETDPIFNASVAKNITAGNVSNRNTAYSRGNHATMGYITSYTETDPVWSAASTNYYTKAQITGLGYITASALTPYVLLSQTGNWNTAYGRGNHASAGYITASALTPYVPLSLTGNWNTAYAWIMTNSGSALSFTTNSGNYYTKTQIDAKGYLTGGLGYTLQVQALTSNPTDGQTVYFGYLPAAPTSTAAIRRVYISKAGTIKAASIYSYSSTAGPNTAWPMYIRLNNTTDTLIASLSLATNERTWTNTSLSIPVVVGDYIEIKSVNPTWPNPNPSGTLFGGYVYIE